VNRGIADLWFLNPEFGRKIGYRQIREILASPMTLAFITHCRFPAMIPASAAPGLEDLE
jgi:hypothetical protein